MYKYRLFTDREVGTVEVSNPIHKGECVMTPENLFRVIDVVHRMKDNLLVDGFETRLVCEIIMSK